MVSSRMLGACVVDMCVGLIAAMCEAVRHVALETSRQRIQQVCRPLSVLEMPVECAS